MKIPVKIIATGSYLPERIVTNKEIIEQFKERFSEQARKKGRETSPEALEKLLGAQTRHAAAPNEQPSDLVVKTAKKILNNAGISPECLTRIIVTPTPGDNVEPATATIVQRKIGAKCPAYDTHSSCPGWLVATENAAEHIALSSKDELILIIGSALMSRDFPVELVQHLSIFGDGAGGVLLGKAKENEGCILGSELMTLGEYSDIICWPKKGNFHMGSGKLLTKLIQDNLKILMGRLWRQTGFGPEDVNFAVIHQPTVPIFEAAVEVSGIPKERVAKNYHRLGNTISAELPITLDEAVTEGRVKRGDIVLFLTFGAGITGGCMLIRY